MRTLCALCVCVSLVVDFLSEIMSCRNARAQDNTAHRTCVRIYVCVYNDVPRGRARVHSLYCYFMCVDKVGGNTSQSAQNGWLSHKRQKHT